MLQRPTPATPGHADIAGLQLLESCAFRWIFDVATHRFLRTPRDATVWVDDPEAWTEYRRLAIDDSGSSFVVELNEPGTRILRAWMHTAPCDRCGRDGWARPEAAR